LPLSRIIIPHPEPSSRTITNSPKNLGQSWENFENGDNNVAKRGEGDGVSGLYWTGGCQEVRPTSMFEWLSRYRKLTVIVSNNFAEL
jgi:hypothetical protein